jgi:hypothetical protein
VKNVGDVPADEKDLPIELPENIKIDAQGSPSKKTKRFYRM